MSIISKVSANNDIITNKEDAFDYLLESFMQNTGEPTDYDLEMIGEAVDKAFNGFCNSPVHRSFLTATFHGIVLYNLRVALNN